VSQASSLTLEDVSTVVTTTLKRIFPSLDDEYELICPSWLPAKLCSFLGSRDAQFTCIEQAHAMVKVLERKDDLLVVLPTGCGKSLLFQLPAFIEQRKMTVVVLPLISLTKDMKRRCTEKGISWEVWRGKLICLHGRA
jgi:replicative superfamily II helicase